MNTFRTAAELEADEKLGEEELQEPALPSVMLPSESFVSAG